MTPKSSQVRTDIQRMNIKIRNKRLSPTECTHQSEMHLDVAGIGRNVCQGCGRVSVSFVKEHISSIREQAPPLPTDSN